MSLKSLAREIADVSGTLRDGMHAKEYMQKSREICELSRDLTFEVADEFRIEESQGEELSWILFDASERMLAALRSVVEMSDDGRELAQDFANNVRERSEDIKCARR